LNASCSELSARRKVQKANKLYAEGLTLEAIEAYEEAIELAPDLAIAHHNLAVAAAVAFKPGIEGAANQQFAHKASKHFLVYLESFPKEQDIIQILTDLWLNSEQTDTAREFWLAELDKKPKDLEILRQLGNIERAAQRYEDAIKWDTQRFEASKSVDDKVSALMDLGRLQYGRIAKVELLDEERLAVADLGIAALQKAIELQPDNPRLYSLMATLYQFRALAQQVSWAQLADAASQRAFHLKRKAVIDAASKSDDKGNEAETPDKPQAEDKK
jgi:tetratricopeptide (TPR) repeat protein